jgi:two-component system, OmpR family, alkaline phosphatase synthesis response regulator PhoP
MRNPFQRKTILVADDESNVRQLVRRILIEDYDVIEASDGQEAVNMAKRKIPDLILMDMMMPGMDGLAACYEIKNYRSTKNIPVLILTAIATEFNKKLALEAWGADRYLTKPFNSQDLLNNVRQVI